MNLFVWWWVDIQKRIGEVDVKTPVYFYVTKNTDKRDHEKITFEEEVVNIGGAMNITSGVFVAPRSGTYFFIFSAMTSFQNEEKFLCAILLRGLEKGDVHAFFGSRNETHHSASLHATSYLKAGDQVFLYIFRITGYPNTGQNPKFVLFNFAIIHYTQFSGGLLQEDL